MTRRLLAALLALSIGAGWAVAQDKPPADPWCAPSTEGWCNPTDPAIVAPYPPDMPPVVKLRAQLAKERAAWRVERRALRAQIADLMDERSGR